MEFQSARALMDLYENIDIFMLVLVRFIGFAIIMPVFSGQTVPNVTKLGFAFCMTILVITSGTVTGPLYTENFLSFFILILSEFATGFVIGFTLYFMYAILYFVGQLVDYQIGFSMVNVFDPISQIQTPVTGNLYFFVFLMFMLSTGGMHQFLAVMFGSFSVIPLGRANLVGNVDIAGYILNMVLDYFEIGFKIAMPIISTFFVINAALGILVKAVPQMNIFVVGMPLKVILGIGLIYVTAQFLEGTYEYFYEYVIKHLLNMVRGMSP